MTNINQTFIARIEACRAENKTPCKSYATQAKAEQVAEKLAAKYSDLHTQTASRPCNYVVVFNQAWGRWVIGFDFSELTSRPDCKGGYIGTAVDDGFFTI